MKARRFLYALLVCSITLVCIIPPVRAAQLPDEGFIWLEDLEWEWIDLSKVEPWKMCPVSRASIPAGGAIPPHSMRAMNQPISLQAGDTVTFNCSYSPSSASLDFGVIAPNGRFYSINVKEGSINQTLGISQSGSYSVAVRNNSSQTVCVVGFVDY